MAENNHMYYLTASESGLSACPRGPLAQGPHKAALKVSAEAPGMAELHEGRISQLTHRVAWGFSSWWAVGLRTPFHISWLEATPSPLSHEPLHNAARDTAAGFIRVRAKEGAGTTEVTVFYKLLSKVTSLLPDSIHSGHQVRATHTEKEGVAQGRTSRRRESF